MELKFSAPKNNQQVRFWNKVGFFSRQGQQIVRKVNKGEKEIRIDISHIPNFSESRGVRISAESSRPVEQADASTRVTCAMCGRPSSRSRRLSVIREGEGEEDDEEVKGCCSSCLLLSKNDNLKDSEGGSSLSVEIDEQVVRISAAADFNHPI
jgi:hypothetical protein